MAILLMPSPSVIIVGLPAGLRLAVDNAIANAVNDALRASRAVAEEKMSSCQPHPQGAFLTIFDNMIERPLGPNLLWIFALEMRRYMEAYGLEPQVVLTTPLIDSWDGTKMSGSKGNYIALSEDPNEQFGKTMRLPDELLGAYYRLVMEQEPPSGEPRRLASTSHVTFCPAVPSNRNTSTSCGA